MFSVPTPFLNTTHTTGPFEYSIFTGAFACIQVLFAVSFVIDALYKEERKQEDVQEIAYQDTNALAHADHPLLKDTLDELKYRYPIGFHSMDGFVRLYDLTLEDSRLYCMVEGTKTSVSKVMADTNGYVRPRWLNYLSVQMFDENSAPYYTLLKDVVEERHDLTFT